ncbi:MAG: hypothetical protein GXY20_12970 [Clostridiales bacterium]|nr:hypothetical protein [Clostridiales bacterium]
MNFSTISTTWALLEKNAKILILTESERVSLAEKIKKDNFPLVSEVKVIDIGINSEYEQEMYSLTEDDLLFVLLTVDGYMNKGYRNTFSPFSKPSGFKGKYIFIRLDIPETSLLSGLNTSFAKIDAIIQECNAFSRGTIILTTTQRQRRTSLNVPGSYRANDCLRTSSSQKFSDVCGTLWIPNMN